MYYDISNQVIPAYGRDVILNDMETLLGERSEGRWAGGEFLLGPPGFFAELTGIIDDLYPRYVDNVRSLHHVGDEAFTSAALERMRKGGRYMTDAGTLGIIARYWNANVAHWQRPIEACRECFLLHLPADKKFIASLASKSAGWREVYSNYDTFCNSPISRAKRTIKRLAKTLVSKQRQ